MIKSRLQFHGSLFCIFLICIIAPPSGADSFSKLFSCNPQTRSIPENYVFVHIRNGRLSTRVRPKFIKFPSYRSCRSFETRTNYWLSVSSPIFYWSSIFLWLVPDPIKYSIKLVQLSFSFLGLPACCAAYPTSLDHTPWFVRGFFRKFTWNRKYVS